MKSQPRFPRSWFLLTNMFKHMNLLLSVRCFVNILNKTVKENDFSWLCKFGKNLVFEMWNEICSPLLVLITSMKWIYCQWFKYFSVLNTEWLSFYLCHGRNEYFKFLWCEFGRWILFLTSKTVPIPTVFMIMLLSFLQILIQSGLSFFVVVDPAPYIFWYLQLK